MARLTAMALSVGTILKRLEIDDTRHIEIEMKRRVLPEQAKALREHLMDHKRVEHEKQLSFFDQYLDTPRHAVLRAGASLRLRYKGDGSNVYLQYKGPGFHRDGILFRSEFSTRRLDHVVREESHHDVVHFTDTTVQDILAHHVDPAMRRAMDRHLGRRVLGSISAGPILCAYQKDKFSVDLGDAMLEPSLDRLLAFHINAAGPHSLSTFWEYENEIKAEGEGLWAKLEHLEDLLEFDAKLAKRFDLRPEKLDKYHRCASCFVDLSRR